MRAAFLTLLILAVVVFAFGIFRWVTLGRQIAEEKEEQTRTGRVVFDLSQQEGWKTSDYTVATNQADANFKEMASAIILQPPSKFDIGWAKFSRGIEIAVIAALGLVLLSASGASWYFARRNIRQEVRSDRP